MKIAISGLGRMGGQIAQKLAENGHEVVAHNRSAGKVDEAKAYGALPAYAKPDVVKAFNDQPVVLWIMIPADVIDSELDEWLAILPTGSIIIDGGNSDYRGDQKTGRPRDRQGQYAARYWHQRRCLGHHERFFDDDWWRRDSLSYH